MQNMRSVQIPHTSMTSNLRAQGTWLHSSEINGFLTLYAAKIPDVAPNDAVMVEGAVANRNDYVILNIGHRNQPLCLDINVNNVIVQNVPVYTGEECWMNASVVNKYSVYGFVSSNPLV